MKLLSFTEKKPRCMLPKAVISVGWHTNDLGRTNIHMIFRLPFIKSECLVHHNYDWTPSSNNGRWTTSYPCYHFQYFSNYRAANGKRMKRVFRCAIDKELTEE